MVKSKNRFYVFLYISTALTLFILFFSGCSSESPTEVLEKRESYFEVTGVMDAPGKGTEDLALSGGSIWVTDSDGSGTIYRISSTDGSIKAENQPPFGKPGSIVIADGSIYVALKNGGGIYRIAANDRMDVLEEYDTGLTEIRGLFYDGSAFYAYDYAEGALFKLDSDFAPTDVFPINAGPRHLRGFRMIDGTLWSTDSKRGWVNTHDASYAIETEYVTICNHPRGIAWDGQYMYLGNPAGRKIYQMDIRQ
ncbi:MAG: hypothetical protein GY771_07665 [bacterium]|nr:hypothetical protein [bacterium]